MAITRSAWEQAQNNPTMMNAIWQYSAMDAGQRRTDAWLREQGIEGRVKVGVVAVWDDLYQNTLEAWAKVIIDGKVAFEHRERPYLSFPSDHFKAKVLLIAG